MSFGSWLKENAGAVAGTALLGPVGGLAGSFLDKLLGKSAKAADIGAPPELPDLTEQAIQIARTREARRNRAGGTASTFLSGVLGPMDQPSTFVKSMLGS